MNGTQRLDQLRKTLNSEFDRAEAVSIDDFKLRDDLARYLCVRVSGFLEQATVEILLDHCRSKNSYSRLERYTSNQLSSFQNPNTGKLTSLLDLFDHEWQVELDDYLNKEGRKEAVNSVVGLRHKVAHGLWIDISIRRIRDYYQKIFEVTDFLNNLLNS